MLTDFEKSYCQALLALKKKDYQKALISFEKASGDFGTNDEFGILYETTKLLLAVKKELAEFESKVDLADKELIADG